MNYVHVLFDSEKKEESSMFKAVVEEATTLTALALLIGTIAIWAQVIVSL